jgi:AcrR family transcriptional regulator
LCVSPNKERFVAVRVDPRADRSRTAALDVARRILVDEGWDALTHARLAERSGLHRATIYRHWPTTTALLHDLLAQEIATAQITPTGNLRADLVKALTVARDELTKRDFGRVLTALIDRGEWDTDLHDVKVTITRAGAASIHELLRRAIEHGELSGTLNPTAGVALLLGPLLYRRLLSGETITREFVNQVVDGFLAGHQQAPSRSKRAGSR